MRAWILASATAALMTLGLMALIDVTRPTPAAAPRAAPCARGPAEPRRAEGTTSVTVLAPREVHVSLDGASVTGTVRVSPGRHVVHAAGPRGEPVQLTLAVDAFAPAVLQLLDDPAGLIPLTGGARCLSCSAELVALPDLRPDGGPFDLDDSARALARGDFRAALSTLAQTPLAGREHGRTGRQLASAWSLAGRPSAAPEPLMAQVLKTRAALASEEARREGEHWLAAWNALTERFRALSDAAAPRAPAVISPASVRLDELSAEFSRAAAGADVVRQGEVHDAAAGLMARTVDELAALFPEDCQWQALLDPWR